MTATPIYRAKLHNDELISCGFMNAPEERKWPIIRGILKAKGLPDWCSEDRTPFRCSVEDDGLVLEFDR